MTCVRFLSNDHSHQCSAHVQFLLCYGFQCKKEKETLYQIPFYKKEHLMFQIICVFPYPINSTIIVMLCIHFEQF
jgi:hypothetical protein